MYQFYYANQKSTIEYGTFSQNVRDHFQITAIRPTMWEEHCLECSAPSCFESCAHYQPRRDGRCKRFANGLRVFEHEQGCCGQGVRVVFRKWANMMTILFPAMLTEQDYRSLTLKNQSLGQRLGTVVNSPLPQSLRWQLIRTAEFIRRRKLRNLSGLSNQPDAFLFHGFSHASTPFQLIVELYDDHTPVFKTSLLLQPGENLIVLPVSQLSPECGKAGNLVKIYPENNLEAALDILWCDFVQGSPVSNVNSGSDIVKCVVWDLDNTLWDGILIETEDTASLTVKPQARKLIEELDARGILQSVASKNDHAAVWPVLQRLGIAEYFLYPQIHWNPKSDSMRQIAQNLNIGIDALALIDDNIFEREEVRAYSPQIRTYDPAEMHSLLSRPEFSIPVTEESKHRRAMYQAEARRNELQQAEFTDPVEFLRQCQLRLTLFDPHTEAERLRCYELIIRTNQLNMSGQKYSRDEFDAILDRKDYVNVAFSCADKFGEYGIIGFGQYRVQDGTLVFAEFAMSCRAAGKYVESALFSALLARENCSHGVFAVQKTKKNALLRKTLESIGFLCQTESDAEISYSFDNNLKHKEIVTLSEETHHG